MQHTSRSRRSPHGLTVLLSRASSRALRCPPASRWRGSTAFACLLALALLPTLVAAQGFVLGAHLDLTMGSSPRSLAIADVNGDGAPDLVTANNGSNTVAVSLGNGVGGFANRTEFATGAYPLSVAIGDLNGDGRPDLAVANNVSGSVSVLLGNGAGGFAAKTDFTVGSTPFSVAIGDVNGDGRPDLAVANNGSNTVSVLLGNGAGGFAPRTDFTTGALPRSVAIADVNGDGRPDLVVANESANTVSVLLGNGAGGFAARTDFATGASPRSVAVRDLNGDGRLDLAVANGGANTVSVLLGNGAGGFATRTDFATGTTPLSVAIGDVSGDGRPDLVVANYVGNSVSVLVGNGSGGFAAEAELPAFFNSVSVAIADLNGDGRVDIAVANDSFYSLTVLLGNGTGSFGARTDYAEPDGGTGALALADLNGDGKLDLAVANYLVGTVSVRLGDGVGGLGPRTDFDTGSPVSALAVGDVNRDGRPDLMVTHDYYSAPSTVSVMLGTGAGEFGTPTDFATGPGARSIAIGDLNRDGMLDLAVANDGLTTPGHTVSLLLGNGAGAFGPKTDFTVGDNPQSVAIGDLNADGKPDLAVANHSSGTVSVLLGNGSGGFGARTDFATSNGPNSVAIGDVNLDGKPDLAVASAVSYTVSVLLGDGLGGFGPMRMFQAGEYGSTSIVIGDVNGDGRPDLAVANGDFGTVSVLLGNGDGYFGPKTDIATGAGPYDVELGDLNGDGRLDLAVANWSAGTTSVLLGLVPTRTALTASPNPAVIGAALTLTANVTVPSPGYGAPADSVRFFDGTTLLGTSPVVSGTARLALFVPGLGERALTAVYKGDGRRYGSLSAVCPLRVVSSASPAIAGITDVKGDQGGQVRLRFRASPFDTPGSLAPIARYDIYRRVEPGFKAQNGVAGLRAGRALQQAGTRPASVRLAGWDFAVSVPARADTAYSVVVPTLADSNASGVHRATLLVSAATAAPGLFYDSAPDSGYSVDNLPPASPAPFTGAYAAGGTHLHWGGNSEPDLGYYRVYRGSSPGFVPGPASLIATRSDTGYVDSGPGGSYYKLSAVDVNGNESGYAVLTPAGTTDVAGGAAPAFALEAVRPNPSHGERLGVTFTLPVAAPARLDLLDVSGRRMASLDAGALGAGRHTVDFAAGHALAPGLYLVRLSQGAAERVSRVVVLE